MDLSREYAVVLDTYQHINTATSQWWNFAALEKRITDITLFYFLCELIVIQSNSRNNRLMVTNEVIINSFHQKCPVDHETGNQVWAMMSLLELAILSL